MSRVYFACVDCTTSVFANSEGVVQGHAGHKVLSKELEHAPITNGSQVSDVTGKSVASLIIANATDDKDEQNAIGLFANYLTNTNPGYRYSDGAREAVRVFKARGIAAVNERLVRT